MKKLIAVVLLALAVGFVAYSNEDDHHHGAEEGHKHEHEGEPEHPHDHDDHAGHDNHGEEGGHDHHEEASSKVGPGKAVLNASEDKGFQLSEAAIRTLGIQTMVVSDPASIPESSLVFYQDMVGVYWLHDGWFKRIRPKRLAPGDHIVISGAGLLRIVELDLFTEDVEGHAH